MFQRAILSMATWRDDATHSGDTSLLSLSSSGQILYRVAAASCTEPRAWALWAVVVGDTA